MTIRMDLPEDLLNKIDYILDHLMQKARNDCVLLADISGQLIATRGSREEG